ncbi:Zn-dependent exopeptidase [Basidiobolus meristosporus CBS 931.73]|uniref:Peptide hydrolase n=1 Tax=Basidiobolus meristosporus CBS 931.73 TaxID=1314790 RepID=A0A1Y1YIL6_9FUNG|nr:Zn-dependent exopeptidase [Basidiobolus meristosporus CBS 931.73]|eukprot:ORX97881.1 Zn-dependent exopeptidase [Basidiobolus meristosporus CBS 931.73]
MKASLALLALTAAAATALKYEGLRSELLQKKITLRGLLRHTDKLQQFANKHNGTRVFGSEGHKRTIDYIYGVVKKAGYKVSLQEFSAPYSETLAQKLSANGKEYTINALTLTASTPKADLMHLLLSSPMLPARRGQQAGKVALIERGGCAFNNKSVNAAKLGAVAAIVYNNAPGDFKGTLGAEGTSSIPTGGISQENGKVFIDLLKSGELKVNLNLKELRENRTTYNVIAETKGGDPTKVIFLGAHSDSVRAGPGINDNGSGSAALLEVARQFGHTRPKNKVRFGWWSAEEFGLLGSEHYVGKLSKTDIDSIAVILNFDMIASPNYVIRVLNGDSSGQPTPAGSEVVTALFEKHFQAKDVVYESGLYPYSRSDVGPFAAVGIPSGGLDTGADELKTEEEAKKFGGKAGQQLDQCYHQACDNTSSINHRAFLINARGIAHAVATYSHDVSSVSKARKGKPAKREVSDSPATLKSGSRGTQLPAF